MKHNNHFSPAIKIIALMLLTVISFSFFSCKSESVKAAEEAIQKIGTVTLNSKETIENARAAYDALSKDEKNEVENYTVLTAAEDRYEELHDKDVDIRLAGILQQFEATLNVGAALKEYEAILPECNSEARAVVDQMIVSIEKNCIPGTHIIEPLRFVIMHPDFEVNTSDYSVSCTEGNKRYIAELGGTDNYLNHPFYSIGFKKYWARVENCSHYALVYFKYNAYKKYTDNDEIIKKFKQLYLDSMSEYKTNFSNPKWGWNDVDIVGDKWEIFTYCDDLGNRFYFLEGSGTYDSFELFVEKK